MPGHATRREFAVYVVIARKLDDANFYIYVGKTGDNREGCNPVISRAGNHFSYNDVHSQVRNKIQNHEEYDYEYIYITFDKYDEDKEIRKEQVNVVNEMERVVNDVIQKILAPNYVSCLLNPYTGSGYLPRDEKAKRESLRSSSRLTKVTALINALITYISTFAPKAIRTDRGLTTG